jgi:ferredoxin
MKENKVEGKVQEQVQVQESSKYTLQHDRPNCIGCAACEAVAPEFWEMNEDGKSDIKNAKNLDNGWQELDFKEKDIEVNKEGADSCPVNVIHIVKKETGEKLI